MFTEIDVLGKCKHCGFNVLSGSAYFWYRDGEIAHLECEPGMDFGIVGLEIEYLAKQDAREVN